MGWFTKNRPDFDDLLYCNPRACTLGLNEICVKYGYRTKNYNKMSGLWQFCVLLCS